MDFIYGRIIYMYQLRYLEKTANQIQRFSGTKKKIINYSKLNKEQNREFMEILTSGVIPTSPITRPLHHEYHRNQCQLVHQVNISLKSQFPI